MCWGEIQIYLVEACNRRGRADLERIPDELIWYIGKRDVEYGITQVHT